MQEGQQNYHRGRHSQSNAAKYQYSPLGAGLQEGGKQLLFFDTSGEVAKRAVKARLPFSLQEVLAGLCECVSEMVTEDLISAWLGQQETNHLAKKEAYQSLTVHIACELVFGGRLCLVSLSTEGHWKERNVR